MGRLTRRRPRPIVLCYHAVSSEWRHPLAVSVTTLERQLRTVLRRGYRPATAAEAVEGSGRLVHVSFDDGFESVHRALPTLERFGMRTTVFACPGFARDGGVFDVPEVAAHTSARPDELKTMSWEGLRSLLQRGIEIGSHTVDHLHLTGLGDRELDAQLRDSRTAIEDELRIRCRILAYPYGEHDARVREAARRAGYEAAFALTRTADLDRSDRYAVPRIDLYRQDDPIRTALKLSRWYPRAAHVRKRLRRRHV